MQKHKVILSLAAAQELENIYAYISVNLQDHFAAEKIVRELNRALLSLETFPEASSFYSERSKYRVIHIRRYKIIFRIDKKSHTVIIVHIFHSLQNT